MIIFRAKSFCNCLIKSINRNFATEGHELSKIINDKPSIARTIGII
jgi:hypothetical protein